MVLFPARQASEQYLTASQFLAQALRQTMGRLHTRHSLLGRLLLLPLKFWEDCIRPHCAHCRLFVWNHFRNDEAKDSGCSHFDSCSCRYLLGWRPI